LNKALVPPARTFLSSFFLCLFFGFFFFFFSFFFFFRSFFFLLSFFFFVFVFFFFFLFFLFVFLCFFFFFFSFFFLFLFFFFFFLFLFLSCSGRKFDQYKSDIPYTSWATPSRTFVRSLLKPEEAETGRWRDSLRRGAGPNGQSSFNSFPRWRLVIGKRQRSRSCATGRAESLPDGIRRSLGCLPRERRIARAVPR